MTLPLPSYNAGAFYLIGGDLVSEGLPGTGGCGKLIPTVLPVPVKRPSDRLVLAKFGVKARSRDGTCETGVTGGKSFRASSARREKSVGARHSRHWQTPCVSRRQESRSRSYAAFFRR